MKKESNDVLSWPLIEQKSSGIKEEVKKQLWLAGPLIAVSLLQFCLQVISVMFGSLPLSAAAVANSFASVTGFTFLVRFFFSLTTLSICAYFISFTFNDILIWH
ncbi:hypothetical protein F2Q69_00011324 [Brassica cretica]|uniref:Protein DETOXIFICATION n=1 Tax=Brassica cretica TaxID=69181 RepID=A0A8S9R6A2_BRACR|nr:hypothetical protein F2Q69_00011324 [Brassica cretica]